MIIIASAGMNNELGRRGRLCWHIREDLQRFKKITDGGCVVMGRKTWESLPVKPLPGRLNIVASTSLKEADLPEGTLASPSLDDALKKASQRFPDDKIFVIGGASIYDQSIGKAAKLEITRILATDAEADTFFPEIDPHQWKLIETSDEIMAPEGVKYRFETYENRYTEP